MTNVLIQAEALSGFCEAILKAAGVPDSTANLVATSLVTSNLRGVDSHGVQLLPFYVEQLEAGDMSKMARGHVIAELSSCLLYDGENGIGQAIAESCCEHGVRIAK